jgi:hypothetical protein
VYSCLSLGPPSLLYLSLGFRPRVERDEGLSTPRDLGHNRSRRFSTPRPHGILQFGEAVVTTGGVRCASKLRSTTITSRSYQAPANTPHIIPRWPARRGFIHCVYGTLYGGESGLVHGAIWALRGRSSFFSAPITTRSSHIFCSANGPYIFHVSRGAPFQSIMEHFP